MDGTGGTYFFKDPSHRNVGCFKPQDEEPFGPHNPRGLVGELGQVRVLHQACIDDHLVDAKTVCLFAERSSERDFVRRSL